MSKQNKKELSASKWSSTMFDSIGLKFEDKCVSLKCLSDKFIDCLKKTVDDFDEQTFENIKTKTESNVNEYWNFEIDINTKETGRITEALKKLNNATDTGDREESIRYLKCVLFLDKGDQFILFAVTILRRTY